MKNVCVAAGVIALSASCASAQLRSLPDLTSVTIYEATFSTVPFTFAPNSVQMLTRVPVLNEITADFSSAFPGPPFESYDAFYSTALGVPDIDGNYITVECRFDGPEFGALNLNEISLDTTSGPIFGNVVTAFYGFGTSFLPAEIPNAADGVIGTTTHMGQTLTSPNGRLLSVTVGFPVPAPAGASLFAAAALVGMRRRR